MKALTAMKLTKNDNMPAKVLDQLFIGSVGAAYNSKALDEIGIMHIVTAASKIKPRFPDKYTYHIIEVLDSPDQDLLKFFSDTNEYIDGVLNADKKNKILVHCFAGKSRATSFTLAYLVGKKKIPLREGLESIRKVRPIVQPNMGFFTQLRIFEK